jgi:hypothetical protein
VFGIIGCWDSNLPHFIQRGAVIEVPPSPKNPLQIKVVPLLDVPLVIFTTCGQTTHLLVIGE